MHQHINLHAYVYTQAKQWVRDFLSLKMQGHQRKFVTPYM